MLKLDWPVIDRPKPSPRPLPTQAERSYTIGVIIAAAALVALVAVFFVGRATVTDDIAALEARITAAENLNAATMAERDHWESEAASATAAYEAIESDVASLTETLELYAERAHDASETIAALAAERDALKASNAKLQQMKRTAPAKDGVTVTGASGWQTSKASWYGPGFYGNKTASGAVLTPGMMNVAHRSLAFGTRIEFRYKGRTCVAVVNDRGPFVAGRVFDLGPGTAAALGFSGVGTVEWRVV